MRAVAGNNTRHTCCELVPRHMWVTTTQLQNTLLHNYVIASGNRSLLLPTSLSSRCSIQTMYLANRRSVIYCFIQPTVSYLHGLAVLRLKVL